MNSVFFFVGICIIGGVMAYINYLSKIVANSTIEEKKGIEVALFILGMIVMFGGVGILYRYCSPF